MEYFAEINIEYFIGLIALTGLFHKDDRRYPILVFFGVLAAYKIIYEISPITGAFYYLISSISLGFAVFLLSKIPNPTKITLRLEDVAMLLILCNAFGVVIYELEYEPLIYDIISRLLLITAIVSTFWKGENSVGDSAIHNYTRVIFGHNRQGLELAQRNQEKNRS